MARAEECEHDYRHIRSVAVYAYRGEVFHCRRCLHLVEISVETHLEKRR